jgi:hypothetical protein
MLLHHKNFIPTYRTVVLQAVQIKLLAFFSNTVQQRAHHHAVTKYSTCSRILFKNFIPTYCTVVSTLDLGAIFEYSTAVQHHPKARCPQLSWGCQKEVIVSSDQLGVAPRPAVPPQQPKLARGALGAPYYYIFCLQYSSTASSEGVLSPIELGLL